VIMSTNAVQSSTLSALSPEEKSRASQFLASTREKFLDATGALSDAQWRFKPSADRWSIAEVVEHVAIVEGRVHWLLGKMAGPPEAEPGRFSSAIDDFILADLANTTVKVKAPPTVEPTGQCTPQEALRQFIASRTQTLQLLDSAPFLRGRVLPHPLFGPWDGYQWILGTAAHSARHAGQILNNKAHADFPKHDGVELR
jgi:hypothetical protein